MRANVRAHGLEANAENAQKAGGGILAENAGNPLGLVGGKEKKFDQKKKIFI